MRCAHVARAFRRSVIQTIIGFVLRAEKFAQTRKFVMPKKVKQLRRTACGPSKVPPEIAESLLRLGSSLTSKIENVSFGVGVEKRYRPTHVLRLNGKLIGFIYFDPLDTDDPMATEMNKSFKVVAFGGQHRVHRISVRNGTKQVAYSVSSEVRQALLELIIAAPIAGTSGRRNRVT